jgi:hypothetical protein
MKYNSTFLVQSILKQQDTKLLTNADKVKDLLRQNIPQDKSMIQSLFLSIQTGIAQDILDLYSSGNRLDLFCRNRMILKMA